MPVAAGIVGDGGVRALLTALDMPAERRGTAALDRRHHLQLVEANVTGVGRAPRRSVTTEDIRDLQLRTGHGRRRLRLRLLRAARLFAFLRSFLWSFPKLLAWLRQRTKLARVHVFDHTLTQRGDSLGCHRQRLSWMRLLTPRSSRQGASPATHHPYPGDNPEPVGQQAIA